MFYGYMAYQGLNHLAFIVAILLMHKDCLKYWPALQARTSPPIGYWVQFVLATGAGLFMLFNFGAVHHWLRARWATSRMKAGAQISVMLESIQYSVGMDYWVHRPDICDVDGCTDIKCKHPTCSSQHPQGCTCKVQSSLAKPHDRWMCGSVIAIQDGAGFTVCAECCIDNKRIEIKKQLHTRLCASWNEILKEGMDQLECVQASSITYELLSAGSGKSNIEEFSEKGSPGDVDFFVRCAFAFILRELSAAAHSFMRLFST
jgi:hypothetical protein